MVEESMERYLGRYMVSRDGKIFLITKDGLRPKKIITTQGGGQAVMLIGGKREYVHKIIADVFLPLVRGERRIKHINGNRSDNRVENLLAYSYSKPKS